MGSVDFYLCLSESEFLNITVLHRHFNDKKRTQIHLLTEILIHLEQGQFISHMRKCVCCGGPHQ